MPNKQRTIFALLALALVALVASLFNASLRAQSKKAQEAAPLPNPNPTILSAPVTLTGPVVGRAVASGETVPARELPAADLDFDPALARKAAREINSRNSSDLFRPDPTAPPQSDGALQATWSPQEGFRFEPNIPAPIVTFEGIPVGNNAPPDTTGAAGPNDYVQSVNATFVRIFDKNGVPRGPAFQLKDLFAPLGGVVANSTNGDPVVLYDRLADRWFITQFAFENSAAPPYYQAVAVSKTGDPTGAWWVYSFLSPGAEFPDYTHWGVWPDGYYATTRQFTNGATYNGFGVFAFDRAKMLVGDSSASFIYFNAGPNLSQSSSGMLPTDFNGLIPPPAGTPNTFAVYTDDAFGDPGDALRLFDFTANFANPASSTFVERPESPLPVAAFDARNPTGRTDIEQPAPATAADNVDSIGDRLMMRLFYINRNGVQLLTTCHTVNAGTIPAAGVLPTAAEYKAGTRWYILQKSTAGANWAVQDQGTFSPDATERWMGSTALDHAGNLAVGYSISSTAVFPSIAYAGRLLGDPAGTLNQGEATMFAGTGVQTATGNRWGDYSHMTLDPSDDSTFWYTNQYQSATGQFNWRTRVGKFKFPNTTAPAQGTLSGTITACDTNAPLRDAIVQVTGGPSDGFSSTSRADGTYSLTVAPGTYTVTVIDPAHRCNPAGPFTVTVTNGGTATQNACLIGTPEFVFNTSTLSATGGNGNGQVEPNECNNINVAILNNGCLLGQNVSAVLSSSTPGVTVTQPNSPYPDATENGSVVNAVPFSFSTSNTFACGTTINFTLTVRYTGGTNTFTFSLPSCVAPPQVVNGTLSASDPVQEGRLGRNAISSICGTAKACPGVLGTGNRRYDVHNFVNGPAAACVTITTTATGGGAAGNIIPAAYLNSYTAPGVGSGGNICINYLGDPGASPNATNSFSVDIPANATLAVVVQEANAAQAEGSTYSVQVAGLVGTGSGSGVCPPAPTAVSRKTHGAAGTFDIPLPLTGTVGVENRTGNGGAAGNHTIVLTYPSAPTGATASIVARNPSGATGSVSNVTVNGNDLIVTLANVTDKQVLTLQATAPGQSSAVVPIGFLAGDVNGNRTVSSSDIAQVKAQAGPVGQANFRADINASGDVNTTDIGITKANSGSTIP